MVIDAFHFNRNPVEFKNFAFNRDRLKAGEVANNIQNLVALTQGEIQRVNLRHFGVPFGNVQFLKSENRAFLRRGFRFSKHRFPVIKRGFQRVPRGVAEHGGGNGQIIKAAFVPAGFNFKIMQETVV